MQLEFDEEEFKTLRWLINSERRVQYMICEPDPKTFEVINKLAEKVGLDD